jgi:hypothetical protein
MKLLALRFLIFLGLIIFLNLNNVTSLVYWVTCSLFIIHGFISQTLGYQEKGISNDTKLAK